MDPSDFGFEAHSPRYGMFLVLGLVDTNCAQFGPFLAILWLFLDRVMEREHTKGSLKWERQGARGVY